MGTLVTRIEDPLLLLAKLLQALTMKPIKFIKSTPVLFITPVCKFGALLGASLIYVDETAGTA